MQRIVDLLNEKNDYLFKFYRLNEEQITSLSEGRFDHLDEFYNAREVLLELVSHVDARIEDFNREVLEPGHITESGKKAISLALREKEDVVQRILAQDLEVLSFIEKEKSKMLVELRQVKMGRKAVGGYRQFDEHRRVDEEA
ncbi:MAG: hypothetical protein CL675_04915 [Bdellovibrionaceae bacterium]|nr:hypothetical protein [Pseudobdellovibrionaceae bacterium]